MYTRYRTPGIYTIDSIDQLDQTEMGRGPNSLCRIGYALNIFYLQFYIVSFTFIIYEFFFGTASDTTSSEIFLGYFIESQSYFANRAHDYMTAFLSK